MKIQHAEGQGVRYLFFHCPACDSAHGISIARPANDSGPIWHWNGNTERPTFSPSVRCRFDLKGERCCHFFVTDGKIIYCEDSTHALAGQTVELPDWK